VLIDSATELGLVDEAKEAVNKWMARWIHIVSFRYLVNSATEDEDL